MALTSSLSLAVAAVAKELCLVLVAHLALGDAVAPLNGFGFALTAAGARRGAGDAAPARGEG